ncbi:sulfate transporter [Hyphodiscus hymeniophilus]|uniref:Sulfate transporter n=1 Tax=Hyphodiscus hymeniophilus TaxID=353542 RepID=A0A9P6VQC7_9HELO|nr:sulfate transporter [Hyphodiscus hymeniophilus]
MSSRRPSSPSTASASHSRNPSINSSGLRSPSIQQHAPINPSSLREAHTPATSPPDARNSERSDDAPSSSEPSPNTYPTHIHADPGADDEGIDEEVHGFSGLGGKAITETTALLKKPFEFVTSCAHTGPCNHGTFSPRLESRAGSVRSGHGGFGGSPSANGESGETETNKSMFANLLENVGLKNGTGGGKKKMSTTNYLAERHGITNTTSMSGEGDDEMHARIAGVVTGMAGAVIFIAGLCRLGFLDSVLSRPFLRGFISAIGFVIVVDQLIPEMGLADLAEEVGVGHGSSVDKLGFLFRHIKDAHGVTCAVAGVSFLIIMVCRELKKRLQPRYPKVAYVPDRFLVVVMSAVLTWQLRWDKLGLEVLGEVKSSSGSAFPFHWPFHVSHMKQIREAMGTSFLIALLGFFESSVAAKSLGGGEGQRDGIQGISLSANRELVALGVANLVGSCFSALPAFGGYGRSKVNASTGGKTPMSSIFLSLITIICVLYLLPAFYYLPKAVLSSMITVVAWSLIEEAPHDVAFFVKIRGYTELGLMLIIFAATIFYSLTLGIAIGVGLSLLSVIKHSTRPRIQILGRIPGTNRFENAEDNPDKLEFVEGCLIVKIPEPLTFANTGDLKNRLRRLELYGTTSAHPALPRVRSEEHNKNIIFDIHGVTGLDGSGTQVLEEIVRGYRDRGVRVFFSRGPALDSPIYQLFIRSGIMETCGGESHFVADVGEAIRLTEVEEGDDIGYANMAGDEGGG